MNSYELKLQQRKERLEDHANRLRNEGNARINRAHTMAEAIPFGQPILIGHHSEKRDRNYRGRIHNGFAKGFETLKAADEVASRAASVGTGGVSSDDPDGVAKLKEQLAKCEANQTRMIAANKALRKNDDGALRTIGFNDATIAKLKEPDFCGRTGFPSFETTNNGANIRRIKERIEVLERNATRETKETERQDGLRILENADENRLQIIFPSKPSEQARAILKKHGFRWSPMAGAWQRHLNNSARWQADNAIAAIDKLNP